jgi:polyisoprenoid-binding protein YceI
MQDHFNSADYMNSDAFPKSEFKGTITNINTVDFTKDATYNITATGSLTIHGFTQKTTSTGTLTVAQGKVSVKSIFKIKRLDYGITTDEISDSIEITVTSKYD